MDRVHRMIKDLINDEQRDFRSKRGCIDQIFTLKLKVEKNKDVYGFYGSKEGI